MKSTIINIIVSNVDVFIFEYILGKLIECVAF